MSDNQQTEDTSTISDAQLFDMAVAAARGEEVAPPEPETVAEAAPEPEKVAAPETVADSGIAKIKKLMAFEAEKREFDQKRKEIETEYNRMRAEVEAAQQFKQRVLHDPAAALKQLAGDKDLADVAKQLWYESLGNEAPPEYRAKKEGRETLSLAEQKIAEFEERQKRLAEEQTRYQQEVAVNQYRGALSSYATAVPETYQLVNNLAKQDSGRVTEIMFKIAQDHARRTGGQVLTPEQTVQALEEKLSGFKALVAPAAAATPAPTKTPAAPTSLRNKQTSNQSTRAVEDDLDDDALFKRAMEAARSVSGR